MVSLLFMERLWKSQFCIPQLFCYSCFVSQRDSHHEKEKEEVSSQLVRQFLNMVMEARGLFQERAWGPKEAASSVEGSPRQYESKLVGISRWEASLHALASRSCPLSSHTSGLLPFSVVVRPSPRTLPGRAWRAWNVLVRLKYQCAEARGRSQPPSWAWSLETFFPWSL